MVAFPSPRIASRRAHVVLAAVVAALLGAGLAGCSTANDSPAQVAAGAPQGEAGGRADAITPGEGKSGSDTNAPPSAEQRSLIYTGTITVRVQSVVQAANDAIAATVGLGGIVAGDTRTISDSGSQATLVLRVPADQFTSTLDRIGKLGTEQNRQVKADDVTETLVDLDARIATKQAAVNRIRDLLVRAQNIGEIVTLENELTNRQAELDSLVQRRAAMAGLVALATITVVFYGPTGPVAGPAEPETGFMAGLRSGWHGFLASVKIVLTVAGWLLPWVIAIGIPMVLIMWVVRRRRRRAAQRVSE